MWKKTLLKRLFFTRNWLFYNITFGFRTDVFINIKKINKIIKK